MPPETVNGGPLDWYPSNQGHFCRRKHGITDSAPNRFTHIFAAATGSPLTKVKLINELNDREARLSVKDSVSWHQNYKDSAWIFLVYREWWEKEKISSERQLCGGKYLVDVRGEWADWIQMTERQRNLNNPLLHLRYGEVVNINLVRDKQSGRSRGFCFLCYEDQRSTVLAVDNLNGIKLRGGTIRVDHVSNYRPPKDGDDIDEVTKTLREKGCGAEMPPSSSEEEPEEPQKMKKHKRKKRKKDSRERSSERSARITETIKQERVDPGYEEYNTKQSRQDRDQRRDPESDSTSAKPAAYDKKCKVEEKPHTSESKHGTMRKNGQRNLKEKDDCGECACGSERSLQGLLRSAI